MSKFLVLAIHFSFYLFSGIYSTRVLLKSKGQFLCFRIVPIRIDMGQNTPIRNAKNLPKNPGSSSIKIPVTTPTIKMYQYDRKINILPPGY